MRRTKSLLITLLFVASSLFSLVQVSGLDHTMDTSLANADGSYIGEWTNDFLGKDVEIVGDVNGDGFDDMIMGAYANDAATASSGQAYLVLGKASGWPKDRIVSNVDASFIGEDGADRAGVAVSGAGDVNGDGFDDILIGADKVFTKSSIRGKVYLILGKSSGWSMDNSLSITDASFVGEGLNDYAGGAISGAGDVNGDGFDDILIGVMNHDGTGSDVGKAYLILGKSSGWAMDTDLATADASFVGEQVEDFFGETVTGVGDVNGDDLDDILIGASGNDEGGNFAGQVYLIFGRETGWKKNMTVNEFNASFQGEANDDKLGSSIAGPRDVNGDGLDDLLIGTRYHADLGFMSGKAYIVMGKTSGWALDTDISTAEASFKADAWADQLAVALDGAGDINGDGLPDMIIGANGNDEALSGAGQSYIVLGKTSGWAKNVTISTVSAVSFWGESGSDNSGYSVAGGGDLNGDGYDDVLIGAYARDTGGQDSGEVYVLFPDSNSPPSSVASVTAFSNPGFTNQAFTAIMNDTIYVELVGTDSNSSRTDIAVLNVTNVEVPTRSFTIRLIETGPATGRYHGNFTIRNRTHDDRHWIGVTIGDHVLIESVQDPTKNFTIVVDLIPIELRPLMDQGSVDEDQEYLVHYFAIGKNPVDNWVFETNASWLNWDDLNHDLQGIPDNGDVGSYWVRINITDGLGNDDEHSFILEVKNTPPNITTADVIDIDEDQEYIVDYNSTDEGQGVTTWSMMSNATWLNINSTTGVLKGTPTNDHLGTFEVWIEFKDGNGGNDSHNFNLTIHNVNDRPNITTFDQVETLEDQLYSVDYNATDVDLGDDITWSFLSNATWLTFDTGTAGLEGTPTNEHVGPYWVNVTATDLSLTSDSHNFTLTVRNVNDPPAITSSPVTVAKVLYKYEYQVLTNDIDVGDILQFSFEKAPDNMTIDVLSGSIEWLPSRSQRGDNHVIVNVTDGNASVIQEFDITVEVPAPVLLLPKDGQKVKTVTPELEWTFDYSGSEELVFDIYLDMFGTPRTVLATGVNGTNFTVPTPLEDGSVYHWNVIPRTGSIEADPSPTWVFTVDTGFLPEYKVGLDVDKSYIEGKAGETYSVNITVTNEGNVRGTIELSIDWFPDFGKFQYDDEVTLDPNRTAIITLNITLNDDIGPGDYGATITARFMTATNAKVLTISVPEPVVPPPPTTVDIWEQPLFWAVIIAIMVSAAIGVGIMSRRKGRAEKALAEAHLRAEEVEDFNIDQIFLIYKDGRLITHVSPRGSAIDEDILGGMLVAIQDFVKESFKAEEGLSSFAFGSRKVILGRGNYLFLTVALSGEEPKVLKPRMNELVQKIEGLYAGRIEDWDGSLDDFSGVEHNLVALFGIKEGLRIKEEREEVKLRSGVEFFSGFVRLKVATRNELSTAIEDVALTISYDKRILRIDHIEPDYPLKGSTVYLDNIEKDEKRTVAFYLDPLICQESHVDGVVTFTDMYGNRGEARMKRRPVDIVCPIFYTPETVNVAMLKRLLKELNYKDSRIYLVTEGSEAEEFYTIAKEVLGSYSVRFVREYKAKDGFAAEAWYFGEVNETTEKLVIKVGAREDKRYLEFFVASSNLSNLTGFLAELGQEMNKRLGKQGDQPTLAIADDSLKDEIARTLSLLEKGSND